MAEEAADLSPGQRPGGVGVPVPWQHVDAESFELTRVQCSEKQSVCHHCTTVTSRARHRGKLGNAADILGELMDTQDSKTMRSI